MTRWRWYAAAAVGGALLLAGAYWAGRATAPERVVTKTDVVHLGASMEATEWGSATREKVVEGPVRIVTKTVTRPAAPGAPAGCPPVQETTVTEERGAVTTKRSSEAGGSSTSTEVAVDQRSEEKVVTARADWALELSGQWPLEGIKARPERAGLALSGRLLGPAWLTGGVTAPVEGLDDLEQYRLEVRLRIER